MPNNALADRVGIAPSTCLARVRSLRERQIVRGFHADIDPGLTGRPIQAIVAVRIQGEARTRLSDLLEELARLPGVLTSTCSAVPTTSSCTSLPRPPRACATSSSTT